jgi:hypothetical protein
VAVYVAFRAALALGTGYRVLKAEQAATGQPSVGDLAEWFIDRLRADDATDEELAVLLGEHAGRLVEVATYNEPFELRKVQMIFSQADALVAADDSRVMTFHLAKISGGSVSDAWVAGDFTALDAAFTAWWTAIKVGWSDTTAWDRIKVYKAGPAIVPPQPPVYDADKNVVGGSAGAPMPPQVAISVTEIAGSKRHWGRFYLPAPLASEISPYGRVRSTMQTLVADSTDTLYTDLRTANLHPVVYRMPLPERETKAGSTLPARAASAWSVEKVQVDDVYDVIRRRRYKYPTLRVQRDI